MRIQSLHIKHFRSIENESIALSPTTALLGPNGSGKSNVLQALNFFYTQNYKLRPEDFYNRDGSKEMSVTVTFSDLSEAESESFAPYMDQATLAIAKVARWNDGSPSQSYHGSRSRHSAFDSVREPGLSAKDKKERYRALRAQSDYSELADASTVARIDEQLGEWESAHQDQCERTRDDGQFFGYTGVGVGKIDQFSKWIFIPAVKEASDEATEASGNSLRALVDLFLKDSLRNNEDLKKLRTEASEKYREILNPVNLAELSAVSARLTELLREYAPGTSVSLGWSELDDLNFPLPSTTATLSEGGFPAPVEFAGHGTQRAFLIAILQHLEEVRLDPGSAINSASRPHVLIGIEEPELYLHPLRAKVMNEVLHLLTKKTEGPLFQTVYATHSPYFVSLDEFESIRLIRRVTPDHEGPLVTKAMSSTLAEVAAKLEAAHGHPPGTFTADTLRARLITIMSALVSEGFFSDKVVLVEGEEDRGIIMAAAKRLNIDLENEGISVIPVGGKTNLDRPFLIFSALDIESFVVFDGDEGGKEPKPETNKALLKLCGEPPGEHPESNAFRKGACFKKDMQQYVKDALGSDYDQKLEELCATLGFGGANDGKKNPIVLGGVFEALNVDMDQLPVIRDLLTTVEAD